MAEYNQKPEACIVKIKEAQFCAPKPATSCNCEEHLNKNGMKAEETIRMEGGVPIVSGPVNMNLRSFFVSNLYAVGRSKGLRTRFNDPKWKAKTTYKKVSKTANKNGEVSNAEDDAKQNTKPTEVVKVPDPPPRPRVDSQSTSHQPDWEVSQGKNVVNLCMPSPERKLLAARPSNDTPTRSSNGHQLPRETYGDTRDTQSMAPASALMRKEEEGKRASSVTGVKHNAPLLLTNETPEFRMPTLTELLLLVDQLKKPKEKPFVKSTNKKISIAEEFKKMVQELAAEDLVAKTRPREDVVPTLGYYESIFGRAFVRSPSPPPGSDGIDTRESKDSEGRHRPVPDLSLGPLRVYDDDEDFALPHERPPSCVFGDDQLAYGVTVTVATVESFEEFIIFDHAGSWRLTALETDMNKFYGIYLMQKRAENRELVVDIVKGGYYGVYIEGKNIWARGYVTSVEPPRPEFKGEDDVNDPEQEVKAILIDYTIKIESFQRKQILPLKRFFLHVAIQKIDAQISWGTKSSFPMNITDIGEFRAIVEGKQFHAYIKDYNPETEPLPTAHLELEDAIYDD